MHRSFETGVYLWSLENTFAAVSETCVKISPFMGQTILYSSTKQSSKVVCDSKPWISPLTDNWSSYSLSSSFASTAAYNGTWSLSYYTCTQIVQSTTRIGVGGLWYVDKQKASFECKYVGSCLSWKVHLHTCNLIISFVGIQIKNLCCSVEG